MASSNDWQAVTLAHVLMGYEANVLGLIQFYFSDSSLVQSFLIISFLLYTTSVALLVLTRFAALAFDLLIAAIVIAFMIVDAIFIIIGVALSSESSRANPYAASLLVGSALLAAAVAILVAISLNAAKQTQRTNAS